MRQVRFRCFEQERKEEELREEESVLEKGSHPYGVQPMGNMYTGTASCIRAGLGAFAPLADQAVLDLLEMLDARRLGLLICCSRALYIFAHHDELWRALVLNVFGGDFDFKSSWKDTFGYRFLNQDYRLHVPRKFAGLYSDLLFQPWLCASMVKDYIFPLFCCCVLLLSVRLIFLCFHCLCLPRLRTRQCDKLKYFLLSSLDAPEHCFCNLSSFCVFICMNTHTHTYTGCKTR